MSEHSTKPSSTVDDEIDLGFIFKAIGDFFKAVLKSFLYVFVFFYKHKFILIVLFVLGVVGGYFWESNKKDTYQNNFIVSTGYGSSDYLYNKIEALNKKIELKDSVFLKSIFPEGYNNINLIEIVPISDIYNFISQSNTNSEVFEILSEDENMEEFILKPVNSRSYPYHKINVYVEGEKQHQTVCENLFEYLNNNIFYKNARDITLVNFSERIEQNIESRQQINDFIKSVTEKNANQTSDFLLSTDDNNNLDLLLERKTDLLIDDRRLKIQIANQQNVIEIIDSNFKLNYDRPLLKKDKKILLPLLLIVFYCFIFFLKSIIVKSREFLNQ